MSDEQIDSLVDYAAWTRGVNPTAVHDHADHDPADTQADDQVDTKVPAIEAVAA